MRKKEKKGKKGTVVNYITRSRALKKLQISLKDFRRLCILKGVYPRQPRNIKKLGKPGQTVFYRKDIQYLAHEPVLNAFRQFKTYTKKLARAAGRRDKVNTKRLQAARPTYTLDHLVKERYPTFTDALRDMDDALSMVGLFAQLPTAKAYVNSRRTAQCAELLEQWHNYVARTGSLTKMFLSIKGVYYEAVVDGVPITWVLPYRFKQSLPSDVDYRVMSTFLEFYQTFLGFTLFHLYHAQGWRYPPTATYTQQAFDVPLTSLAALANPDGVAAPTAGGASKPAAAAGAATSSLQAAVSSAAAKSALPDGDAAMEDADDEEVLLAPTEDGPDEPEEAHAKAVAASAAEAESFVDANSGNTVAADGAEGSKSSERLFSGLKVFLSREVPRYALEFPLRSAGAEVSWDAMLDALEDSDAEEDGDDTPHVRAGWMKGGKTLGPKDKLSKKGAKAVKAASEALKPRGPVAPFPESDSGITHVISDRPMAPKPVHGRVYVQSQWVVDSINAGLLLPTSEYAPGAQLPPHLSPWVDDEKEGYTPARQEYLKSLRTAMTGEGVNAEGEGEEDDVEEVIEGENDDPESEEESESGEEDDGSAMSDEGAKAKKGKGKGKGAKAKKADPAHKGFKGIKDHEDVVDREFAGRKIQALEAQYLAELAQEALGDGAGKESAEAALAKEVSKDAALEAEKAARKRKAQDAERERAHIMMPKKKRRLYASLKNKQDKKENERTKLRRKRAAHEAANN